jgi:hypothetical protein
MQPTSQAAMSGGWPSQAARKHRAARRRLGLDGLGAAGPELREIKGIRTGAKRRPFASRETGQEGSRRSVSIAPPFRRDAGSTASGEGFNIACARDRHRMAETPLPAFAGSAAAR